MRKVTVITLQNVKNYGSALQALATQRFFEDLDCEVDFINYLRPNIASPYVRAKVWCKRMNPIKRWFYTAILIPTFKRQNTVFERFLSKYLNVQQDVMTTQADFARLPITSDVYVTGSDQTWNSAWNGGILPELFLNFVPDNVKKIAYAASMGKGKLDEEEKAETRQLLQRYAAISVRESTAVKICNNLGIQDAVQVLDPTLQMKRDYWLQYARKPKEQGYVLIYQLNTNPQFDRYAQKFARRKGLQLLRFCTRYDQMVKCGKALVIPEVTDFISYIAHANCVITDSFHATAFSINLNTPFISIYPQEFGSRLASILELTGLKKRHLTNYDDFSFVENTNVDFTHANQILNAERVKAREWMIQRLGCGDILAKGGKNVKNWTKQTNK